MMKLYSYFASSAAFRVRIVLNLKGIPHEMSPVHLVRGGGEQRQAAFLARNPQGLVPALEVGEATIAQSLAIIDYLEETHPEPPLLPADPLARAKVREIAYHIACDIHPLNNLRVRQYLGGPLAQSEAAVLAWYHHWIRLGFTAIEAEARHGSGRYLFGDRPTLADVCLVPQMWNARRYRLPLEAFPRLVAVDAALRELEAFAAAVPERQADYEAP